MSCYYFHCHGFEINVCLTLKMSLKVNEVYRRKNKLKLHVLFERLFLLDLDVLPLNCCTEDSLPCLLKIKNIQIVKFNLQLKLLAKVTD